MLCQKLENLRFSGYTVLEKPISNKIFSAFRAMLCIMRVRHIIFIADRKEPQSMVKQQKDTSSQTATSGTSQKMTQLEGIRQKVFMDRYSLKDPSGQALEFYPEQLWTRVARGIAFVEPTDEQRVIWEKRFYEALSGFQFVPGGRILAGAGSGHQVTYYNCLSGDTLVHTREGMVPIGMLRGEHEVL